MRISIKRWKTLGLRCPDADLMFKGQEGYSRVNLLLMPNGTGKTTLITLLQHALTGRTVTNVEAFRSADYDTDTGEFELELEIEDDNGLSSKLVLIRIEFNFATSHADFYTSYAPVGLREGWKPPNEISPFLRASCVDAFVFKGDKAQALLDRSGSDASNAVKAFFGFDWVDEAIDSIESEFSTRIKSRASSEHSHQKGLNKRKKDLEIWQKHFSALRKKKKALEDKKKELEEKSSQLYERIEALISNESDLQSEKTSISENSENAHQEVMLSTENLMNALRNPIFVSSRIRDGLVLLKNNLDRLQLPGTSKVFFDELVQNSDHCICGRVMDNSSKESIREKSKSFLADEDVIVINGIKKDIDRYQEQSEIQSSKNPIAALSLALKNQQECIEEARRFEKKIRDTANEQDQETLDEWKKIEIEVAKLDSDIKVLGSKEFSDPDKARKQSVLMCKDIHTSGKVVQKILKEISVASHSAEEYQKKESLIEILRSAYEKAYQNVTEQLKENSNQKLSSVLIEGTTIQITNIASNIELSAGGVRRESASGGESASIAYSFVNSVLEESGVRFPLLVDHPVTALQYEARTPLAKAISAVSHQFIAFLINTEIEGFVEPFIDEDNPRFYTLFRTIVGNRKHIDRAPPDSDLCTESRNGFLCRDKEYFLSFKKDTNFHV